MKLLRASEIKGVVSAPPSKSMMQRAVLAGTLAHGKTILRCPSYSEDGRSALRAARALGALVEESAEELVIQGGREVKETSIDCGESGLLIRLLSAVVGLSNRDITLEAHGSLRTRPLHMIEAPLRACGVEVALHNGLPPVRIRGPLQGTQLSVDGSISSQFVSGLLMALPCAASDSELHVENLKSKPYVSMTLQVLSSFGITIEANHSLSSFSIPGAQKYVPTAISIEGDWSGAASLLVAGAIAGEVEVRNLSASSAQADRAILDALRRCGARVELLDDAVKVRKEKLHAFEFDATDCPDLFPVLSVLACAARGETIIHGAERLIHKESNRGAALKEELGTLGADIRIEGNLMRIKGGPLQGGTVFSHHDHRIAMACALAGIVSKGVVEITNSECVSKSFPNFFEALESLRI